MQRTIYLDTMLWNRLYEQSPYVEQLVRRLSARGLTMVFSPHLRYELSKTFVSTRARKKEIAADLFGYVQRFVKLQIPCVKQVIDLFREEIRHASGQTNKVECFYEGDLYQREAIEISKLASGQLDSSAGRVLDFRSSQVRSFRSESPERGLVWRRLMDSGRGATFADSLEVTLRELGLGCLRKHVSNVFPELRQKEARRIARKLFSSRRYRLSHALIRGDLYLDWRCFRTGVLARDAADDCYHIENAAYCDFYATGEQSQESYANEMLSMTEIRVHNDRVPVEEWLASLAIVN